MLMFGFCSYLCILLFHIFLLGDTIVYLKLNIDMKMINFEPNLENDINLFITIHHLNHICCTRGCSLIFLVTCLAAFHIMSHDRFMRHH